VERAVGFSFVLARW